MAETLGGNEMKQIQLKIEALSPLAIGRQKPGGSVSESENYIPGSVIRGAIAGQILQQSGQQSANLAENGGDFQALFLEETPAIFRNAYPASLEIDGHTIVQEEVRVLPATALSSKTQPGFKPQGNNGVFDTLIDRFCAEEYGHLYDPTCPTDGKRVDPYSGFYSKLHDEYYSHTVSKRLLTRVGINRRRTTAEEEILYSIEVLNESQGKKHKPVTYIGSILIADTQLFNSISQFINKHTERFRLGGSASRGLGKVRIKAESPIESKPQVSTQINHFNEVLKERWKFWRVFNPNQADLPEERIYFTIDLQSDAILTEQWQGTTVISEAMLCQFADVQDDFLQLHTAYSSYDYRSGWNTAWGLMKDVELVTNKGAVYLFSTTKERQDEWTKALAELGMKGVGERTSEGFGQIQVCNEFHLIFREDAK